MSIIRLVRKVMVGLMEDRLWRTLDDEQLVTLAKEIEYKLNCRSLTRASSDPTDMSAITPQMILSACLDPASAPDVFCKSDELRSSWRATQLWADKFWQRWQSEYLPLLHKHLKWLVSRDNFEGNDLVFMVGEGTLRSTWSKAIITGIMTHADGAVRRVTLRTANRKEYIRDIRKLRRLEGDLITA